MFGRPMPETDIENRYSAFSLNFNADRKASSWIAELELHF